MSCLSIGSVIIEFASFLTNCPDVLECIRGILGVRSFTYRYLPNENQLVSGYFRNMPLLGLADISTQRWYLIFNE